MLLFAGPFVRIHGQPLLLLNILERKFILFGFVFWPQDFYLVVLGLLTLILTIVLFTSVFGRIWCGWACPQTIFMEMVFRKIEYWLEGDFQEQKKLAAAPWTAKKLLRKAAKFGIFYAISFAIANTFLAYIIGSDALLKIISEPIAQHLTGFIAIHIFTLIFFLVFARFREQVCHFACPYGRFQSVLVDNDTICVTYDFQRGEKRATLGQRKKAGVPITAEGNSTSTTAQFGDCIDCGSCVVVCPAGIDIRNGIQLECIQCTACIDACNKMMDAIKRPRGLIRYTSYNAVKHGKARPFKLRTAGYLTLWLLLLSLFTTLLLTREKIETVLLRAPGMLAQKLPDGWIGNLYTLKIFNKTFSVQDAKLQLPEMLRDKGEIRFIDSLEPVAPQNFTEVRFLIALRPEAMPAASQPITLEIWLNGHFLRKIKTVFVAAGA